MSYLICHYTVLTFISVGITIVIELSTKVINIPECDKRVLAWLIRTAISLYMLSQSQCDDFSRFIILCVDIFIILRCVSDVVKGICEMVGRHVRMTGWLTRLKAQIRSVIKRPVILCGTECGICLDKTMCTYIIHSDGSVPHTGADHVVCFDCLSRIKVCPYCRAPLL